METTRIILNLLADTFDYIARICKSLYSLVLTCLSKKARFIQDQCRPHRDKAIRIGFNNDSGLEPGSLETGMLDPQKLQASPEQRFQESQELRSKSGQKGDNAGGYRAKSPSEDARMLHSRIQRESPERTIHQNAKDNNEELAPTRRELKAKKPIKRGQEPLVPGDKIGLEIQLLIEYTDAQGSPTKRTIDVEWVTFEGVYSPLIFAYCHLRQDYRSFYVDRISRCVNSHSGVIYTDIEEVLREKCIAQSKEFEKIVTEHEAALNILLYASRKNGKLTTKKKELIAAYLAPPNCKHKVSRRFIVERLKRIKACSSEEYDVFTQKMSAMSTGESKRLQLAINEILSRK